MKEVINHSEHLQACNSTLKKKKKGRREFEELLLGFFFRLDDMPRNRMCPNHCRRQAGENGDSSEDYISGNNPPDRPDGENKPLCLHTVCVW